MSAMYPKMLYRGKLGANGLPLEQKIVQNAAEEAQCVKQGFSAELAAAEDDDEAIWPGDDDPVSVKPAKGKK